MVWSTLKTWAVNDILTAGDLNTYVRDNGNMLGKMTAYTPTWTAPTTNPVIGNGSITGRYFRAEEWVWFHIGITCGSTTTGGSGTAYSLTLPVAVSPLTGSPEQHIPGHTNRFGFYRLGAGGFIPSGSSTISFFNYTDAVASPANSAWGPTIPFTFAAPSNSFTCSGTYRIV
jgi:hypothetical protein